MSASHIIEAGNDLFIGKDEESVKSDGNDIELNGETDDEDM